MTTRSVRMQADTHFRLPLPGRWRVSCVQGCVWITAENDMRDHVLQGGDSRIFCGNASLLIGALQDSRLQLEWLGLLPLRQLPGWRARLLLLMQRCWQYPASRFYTNDHVLTGHDVNNKESSGVEQGVCEVCCEKRN